MDLISITSFVTVIVTYIFGFISKKYNWVESQYIPVQNLVIGVIASVLYYLFVDNSNIMSAVIVVFSSLAAGGLYDLQKTNNK